MNIDTQRIVREEGWDKLWEKDIHPWDNPTPSPALVEVIEQKPIKDQIPKSGRVLVPGCGRGVDVFYLGNEQRSAIGMDISPIAVQQCKDIRESKGIPASHADFMVADFFTHEAPEGGYSLIYDYTFFCAIDPSLRAAWAKKMAEVIPSGGVLITLIFPLRAPDEKGPPFYVTVDAYRSLLQDHFENLLLDECTSIPSRQGLEKIAVWRRK
ncbi:hypothetical protein DFQ26_000406 [Actinomortierella ambigua]|nr:hypothetical protein DFQ26_000406 [Actinomortierella ambigua]